MFLKICGTVHLAGETTTEGGFIRKMLNNFCSKQKVEEAAAFGVYGIENFYAYGECHNCSTKILSQSAEKFCGGNPLVFLKVSGIEKLYIRGGGYRDFCTKNSCL